MNKDSKIFVAGHKGLVGSAIVRKLKELGYSNIITKDRIEVDLLDFNQVDKFFNSCRPEYVFLAAAKVGGIKANSTYKADFIWENIMIQSNVIKLSHVYSVKKLLFLGSSCIYPKMSPQPIKEDYLLSGYLESSNDAYAIAKISGIKMCQSFNQQYGTDFISIMPCNIYGPCFSGDTDVMTPNGIINIKELKIGDDIYTLNPKTHILEIEKIISTQINNTNQWYNFKGRNVDFKVTPDHKIYYKSSGKFVKRRADYFKDKIGKKYGQITFAHHSISEEKDIKNVTLNDYCDTNHIHHNGFVKDGKQSKRKYFPLSYDAELFCKLLGWYIGEGSFIKNKFDKDGKECGQIRITQLKSANVENYNSIFKLLTDMKIPFGYNESNFYFNSRLFLNFIKTEIGTYSHDKKIPQFVFSMPLKCRISLFESLMSGDGDKNGNRYTTKSDKLKDDFIKLCFSIGIKTGKVYFDKAWRITIRNKRKLNTVKYKNISIENCISEKSYCVTTEKNHIIYAGRNYCFNWIGQCDNYHPENSHVFPAMIRKFHEAKVSGTGRINLWGDGSPYREFLFSDDLADACHFVMTNSVPDLINIGSGKDQTIKELAYIMKDVIYPDCQVEFNGNMYINGTPKKLLDVSLINSFGWVSKTTLEEGIKASYNDFLMRYEGFS